MTFRLILVGLILLCLAIPLCAQDSALSLKPSLAYRFTSAKESDLEMQTSMVVDVPIHYLVPLTADGTWNLQVIGGGGAGTHFTNVMIGAGIAAAPPKVLNVMFGLAFVIDISWPDAEFTQKVYGLGDDAEIPDETWVTIGGELSLDFIVPLHLPGTLVAGAGYGLRDKPDNYYVAFQVPVTPSPTEERVKRVAD